MAFFRKDAQNNRFVVALHLNNGAKNEGDIAKNTVFAVNTGAGSGKSQGRLFNVGLCRSQIMQVGRVTPCAPVLADGHHCQSTRSAGRKLAALPVLLSWLVNGMIRL
jgi:hypothetical protein